MKRRLGWCNDGDGAKRWRAPGPADATADCLAEVAERMGGMSGLGGRGPKRQRAGASADNPVIIVRGPCVGDWAEDKVSDPGCGGVPACGAEAHARRLPSLLRFQELLDGGGERLGRGRAFKRSRPGDPPWPSPALELDVSGQGQAMVPTTTTWPARLPAQMPGLPVNLRPSQVKELLRGNKEAAAAMQAMLSGGGREAIAAFILRLQRCTGASHIYVASVDGKIWSVRLHPDEEDAAGPGAALVRASEGPSTIPWRVTLEEVDPNQVRSSLNGTEPVIIDTAPDPSGGKPTGRLSPTFPAEGDNAVIIEELGSGDEEPLLEAIELDEPAYPISGSPTFGEPASAFATRSNHPSPAFVTQSLTPGSGRSSPAFAFGMGEFAASPSPPSPTPFGPATAGATWGGGAEGFRGPAAAEAPPAQRWCSDGSDMAVETTRGGEACR